MDAWIVSPVLADGIGTTISVVVLVIAFLSWIVNLINGQNQPPRARGPQNRPPRPGQDRLQNEIEVFLQEVQGRKKPDVDPQAAAPRPVREPPPRPQRPKPPARRPQRKSKPVAERPRRRRPVPAERKPIAKKSETKAKSAVGSLEDRHLESRIEGSVAQHLKPLESDIAPAVQPDPAAASAKVRRSATDIATLLRSPAGVRQAILLNEILSRPIGLRSRS